MKETNERTGDVDDEIPTPSSDGLVFVLPNGIHLTVWKTSESLGIHEVADFLAEGIKHFKHHRDDTKTELYTADRYSATVKKARKKLGTIELSCCAKERLPVALWTEAVIHAYSNANSVEQMLDDLPTWQQATEREGGTLREIVKMLDKPGGDLLAFAAMLERKQGV